MKYTLTRRRCVRTLLLLVVKYESECVRADMRISDISETGV